MSYSTLPRSSVAGKYRGSLDDDTFPDESILQRTYSKVILRRPADPFDGKQQNRRRRNSLYLTKKNSDPSEMLFFAERKKDSSLDLLVHGLHLTKTDLKKMEKLTKINIHLHGNFTHPHLFVECFN